MIGGAAAKCLECGHLRATHAEGPGARCLGKLGEPCECPGFTTAPPPPWTCERCGKGDNATRYHNAWDVSLDGECPAEGMPDVGEQDCGTHQLELCDDCAQKGDTPTWCLVQVLRVHLSSRSDDRKLTAAERELGALLARCQFGKAATL